MLWSEAELLDHQDRGDAAGSEYKLLVDFALLQ